MSEKEICGSCAKQVKRLGNKPFFEAVTREGMLELVNTLHRYGHAIAEAVIDEALVQRFGDNGVDRVPSSSDLWALCKADPATFETAAKPPAASEASPKCPGCAGTGWTIVKRGDLEGAKRCTCGVPPKPDPFRPFSAPSAKSRGGTA